MFVFVVMRMFFMMHSANHHPEDLGLGKQASRLETFRPVSRAPRAIPSASPHVGSTDAKPQGRPGPITEWLN